MCIYLYIYIYIPSLQKYIEVPSCPGIFPSFPAFFAGGAMGSAPFATGGNEGPKGRVYRGRWLRAINIHHSQVNPPGY